MLWKSQFHLSLCAWANSRTRILIEPFGRHWHWRIVFGCLLISSSSWSCLVDNIFARLSLCYLISLCCASCFFLWLNFFRVTFFTSVFYFPRLGKSVMEWNEKKVKRVAPLRNWLASSAVFFGWLFWFTHRFDTLHGNLLSYWVVQYDKCFQWKSNEFRFVV